MQPGIKKYISSVFFSLPHIKRKRKKYIQKIRGEYKYTEKTPSIICSTCIGGLIYSNLGLQFMSPTINLWIYSPDFVKLACNLKEYLASELEFLPPNNKYTNGYPVGKLKDIVIHFNHFKTKEEALYKWNERAKRVDFDNLYFITDDNGLNHEDILKMQKVECKRALVFTATPKPQFNVTYWLKRYGKTGAMGEYCLRDPDGFREFEKSFDFVKWLNGDEIF